MSSSDFFAPPKTQLALPSLFFSRRTETSLSSNDRISTGPEISDHSPTCVENAPDLQHLRLRAPFRVADADVLGQQRDRWQDLELERAIDRERPAQLLCDESLDLALVPTQVGESDIEHDREEQGSDDGKHDDDDTA